MKLFRRIDEERSSRPVNSDGRAGAARTSWGRHCKQCLVAAALLLAFPAAARAAAWRLGSPYWTGPANGIRYRLRGDVRRLRAYFVRSAAIAVPPRRLSIAGSPLIVPRLGWSANERIRRAPPRYAPSLRLAIVHHTAGSNPYSPSQSAAIVRAIEIYHVLGNGWDDIGYNFLVDKYGQVFEGRYG